ncbi:MAG: NUDIX domain-containing protein [Actinomycetota bacterium]|nr:NUDIX domain-containing protein [Actinomycetota bacterium]
MPGPSDCRTAHEVSRVAVLYSDPIALARRLDTGEPATIGGNLEEGEEFESALRREAAEEAGVELLGELRAGPRIRRFSFRAYRDVRTFESPGPIKPLPVTDPDGDVGPFAICSKFEAISVLSDGRDRPVTEVCTNWLLGQRSAVTYIYAAWPERDPPTIRGALFQAGALRKEHICLRQYAGLRHSLLKVDLGVLAPRVRSAYARDLCDLVRIYQPDVVASLGNGGTTIGEEVARGLDVNHCQLERASGGSFVLRRGPVLLPHSRVALIDNAVHSGRSLAEAARLVLEAGAEPVVAGLIVRVADPALAMTEIPLPLHACVTVLSPSWDPENCPECLEGGKLR